MQIHKAVKEIRCADAHGCEKDVSTNVNAGIFLRLKRLRPTVEGEFHRNMPIYVIECVFKAVRAVSD